MTFPDFSTPGAGTDQTGGPAHARVLAGTGTAKRVVALVATGVLVLVGVGAATVASRFTSNIETAGTQNLTNRPEKVVPDPSKGEPVNLLMMGSDSREGENADIGGAVSDGERSDTAILVHISADRSRVDAVSIPRDSTVDVPSCVTTTGESTAPHRGKFNDAFATGAQVGGDTASGALCSMQTLEALTGVFVDGFMVLDFAGFQRMIDAVGGVTVCVEEEINAPQANDLHLDAGEHLLDGKLALDFARARKGVGDGSDLQRIDRQQQLLGSLVRTVFSADTLSDPSKTLSFIDAVTSSMTMDEDTARLDYLTGLAYSLRDLDPDAVTFMTVPYAPDPYNTANVVWSSEADQVWANVIEDRPLDHDPTAASASPSAGTGDSPGPSDSPSASGGETIESTSSVSTDDDQEAGSESSAGTDPTAVCG